MRFFLPASLLLFASAFAMSGSLCAQDTAKVVDLPALNSADAWTLDNAPGTKLMSWPDHLAIDLDLKPGKTAQILLKEPQPLPEDTKFLRFTLGAEGSKRLGFTVRVLIRDARGAEYGYKAFSPNFRGREWNYFVTHAPRSSPQRLTLPGLAFPVVTKNNPNIYVMKKPTEGALEPVAPLQVIGLEFLPEGEGSGVVYVGEFKAGEISPLNSKLYYLLNKNESYVETDGLPNLALGFFGPNNGESFKLVWDVRDRFDGQPFLSGLKEFKFDVKDPAYTLNFNQRIEFPITKKGVYWVHVRRIWSNKADALQPGQIDEWDFRLDILKGDAPEAQKVIAANEPLAGSAVRIAPERKSMVYADGDEKTLAVEYKVPANAKGALTYRLHASNPASGKVVETKEGALEAKSEQVISTPLAQLPAGAYKIRAEILEDGKVIDWTERLIDIAGAKGSDETQPDPKADWKQLTKDKSLIYIGMNKGNLPDPVERIAKVKSLLDEAKAFSDVVEYEVHWADIEPMPGVYDWSEIDEILAYAKEKGMTVLLYPTFIGGEPDWIPSHFQKRSDGSISGAKGYLYQGGRINFWHSPELQQYILDLVVTMAKRYRGNPTVHGYFLLVEHGGDNPASGFYPGYEIETLQDYREYNRGKWSTIQVLNKRWGTNYSSWEEVTVPATDATERQRLDWYVFRKDRLGDFFLKAAAAIRKEDPYKLMMLYTGAVDVDNAEKFAAIGCMMADGGAAIPETGASRTMGMAEMGLPRRTEEVSVGAWAGDFPTQLDATVFNLTLGGGKNANCKMFFVPGRPLADIRKMPYAFDRFEYFIPIWKELAKTETLPKESAILLDRDASMLSNKSTGTGMDLWADMCGFDAHVQSPALPLNLAQKKKMIFLPPVESYEKPTLDGLVSYVKDGGTLVMYAVSGRRSPDLSGDWLLLSQLGINAPAGGKLGMQDALPSPGSIYPPEATAFKLRDSWQYPPQDGATVLATYDKTNEPAITRHAVGKGFVDVIWASTAQPPTVGGSYPFVRELAKQAGVATYSDSDKPSLWTNLLKGPANGNYYGTVYHASWGDRDRAALAGTTFWTVPAGNYEVTELITGKSLGRMSAEDLVSKGIPTELVSRGVAIYRFAKQ